MGPGAQFQFLGGSVTAWCWILVDSGRFLAKIARGLGLIWFHFFFNEQYMNAGAGALAGAFLHEKHAENNYPR